MYNYQKSNRYFAQVADDIKDITRTELESFGASDISDSYRGLHFNADKETLYKTNLKSALINRVLAPIISFSCHSDKYLYNTAHKIEWKDFLNADHTFAIFASVNNSAIKHSKYAALKLKDAIADYFRKKSGKRPNVDTKNPDIWINLNIQQNEAVISIDTSGGSLHRRGYRVESHQAPMIETLAAALIQHSGWDGTKTLHDPFCGSGTILCEAYLKVTKTPPSLKRKKFGFMRLPDYSKDIWSKVRTEAESRIIKPTNGLLTGSDISSEALNSAIKNCSKLHQGNAIRLSRKDVFKIDSLENKIIICNPPYGIRLNKKEDLSGFYKSFGDFLKQKCNGSTAFVYFGDRKYIKNIGLRTSFKKPLQNGGLDGRLARFDLY